MIIPVLALLAACGADPLALDQAIKDGRLNAVFTNTGNSSGDVCVGNFKHAQGESFNLQLPRGTVLRNGDDSRESFVLIKLKGKLSAPGSSTYKKQETLVLGSGDEFLGGLECYSLNALLDPPADGDTFQPDGVVSGDTKAVVDAIDSDANLAANQIAIWATTDDISREDIEAIGYTIAEGDIDAAKAIVEKAKLDPAKFKVFQ